MTFKFICLNLWLGGKLFDNVLDFLNREKPDVLALQEVYNGEDLKYPKNYRTIEEFSKTFDYKYVDFAPAFLDHKPDGAVMECGNAIFSKYPIVSREVTFYDIPFDYEYSEDKMKGDFSNTPRNLQHVQLNIEGKIMNVFNTQGIWGFDGEDNPRRFAMGKIIREKYLGKENVILCGDFNTLDHAKAMTAFETELKNVFKGELSRTFNMFHKPEDSGFATAVVDMVYASPNIGVVNHYTVDEDVTDHVPLVCVFSI